MRRNKFLCIGPGGRKCSCCFPAPGSKARRLEYRRAKRRDYQEVRKDILSTFEEKEIEDSFPKT